MKNNFAYFIASYGKPKNIPTYNVLKQNNANYPIYIIVGTDDPKLDEYKQIYKDNLFIFDKADYIPDVDDLGIFSKTHKVCTYSRLAIFDLAKQLNVKYVGYFFDDINYFQVRYSKNGKVYSSKKFNIDDIIDLYIDLLNCSDSIYFVGAPQSSFYIGIKDSKLGGYTTRYGNMFIYDTDKQLEKYRSSILEDMDIVIMNNKVGKMSICPGGLQVCCRDPHTTKDCYGDMSKSEYYQHLVLLGQREVNIDRPIIPYSDFTPKIIDEKYRRIK